jgi:hypothetical protein
MRRILASMLIEGIRAGEIKPVNVRAMDDLLYGIIEAAIFHLVILKRSDTGELKKTVEQTLAQISSLAETGEICHTEGYERQIQGV